MNRYKKELWKQAMENRRWKFWAWVMDHYLAEVNGVRCTAIFNVFTGAYYVDDVYGIQQEAI